MPSLNVQEYPRQEHQLLEDKTKVHIALNLLKDGKTFLQLTAIKSTEACP